MCVSLGAFVITVFSLQVITVFSLQLDIELNHSFLSDKVGYRILCHAYYSSISLEISLPDFSEIPITPQAL